MMLIRPPEPSERGVVSELILQSDCGLLTALFGAEVCLLLTHLQSKPSNPYSSSNILVIADQTMSPSIVGALVGSRMDEARRSNLRAAALLFRWYGSAVITRFSRLARAGRVLEGLGPADFYLSHIAVLPERRGRGAGRDLLRAGEQRARKQGATRLVLDVEAGNGGARSFYDRLDYRLLSVVRIDLGRRGTFSFLRLCKGL